MTTTEAQALYDQLGTTSAVAAHLGCDRSRAWQILHALGVKMQKKGGWKRGHELHMERKRRPTVLRAGLFELKNAGEYHAKAHRAYCAEQDRPCVIHDLGDCDACRAAARVGRYAGISSTFEVQGLRR